jgi:protocatechuate 3,4-dioxygenase beta subunit
VVDDARRSWLRQRAQAQAAAPAPPTTTPPAKPQEESRQPSQLLLETEAQEAWLGEALTLRGRLSSSDKGLARQAVEVWLIDPQRPLQARLLGALVTDAQGRYAGAVRLPVDLPPAEYDVVARFAGSAGQAPADSERVSKTR